VDELDDDFRELARALGRVRDLDVRINLLVELEGKLSHLAPTLVAIRHGYVRRRLEGIRRLIKRMEKVEVDRLVRDLATPSRLEAAVHPYGVTRGWRPHLRRTLRDRACATAVAVQRAAGVYFPNRLHRARIAIKKLRYSLEIGAATGWRDVVPAIAELKKIQDVLGDLRDRQTLADDLTARMSPGTPAEFSTLVTELIEAECSQLHQRYLARRERLTAICADIEGAATRWPRPSGRALVAGALAVSTGMYLARCQRTPPIRLLHDAEQDQDQLEHEDEHDGQLEKLSARHR
jgi:CHAD domain-containing protein